MSSFVESNKGEDCLLKDAVGMPSEMSGEQIMQKIILDCELNTGMIHYINIFRKDVLIDDLQELIADFPELDTAYNDPQVKEAALNYYDRNKREVDFAIQRYKTNEVILNRKNTQDKNVNKAKICNRKQRHTLNLEYALYAIGMWEFLSWPFPLINFTLDLIGAINEDASCNS